MSFSSRANVTRYSLPDIEGEPDQRSSRWGKRKTRQKIDLFGSVIYLLICAIYIYIYGATLT